MWHTRESAEVLTELNVDPARGLTAPEAATRLQQHGPNRLTAEKKKSLLVLFLAQLNDATIYILLAAAAISGVLGEISDAAIMLLVVLLNGVVGVVQEAKAEQALEALKKLSAPRALVRRDGSQQEVDAATLVPGDMVVLETGRVIPCDLRLVESSNLRVQESALTGESVAVDKDADIVLDSVSAPLGDRRNMAHTSTVVTYGRGLGVAVATGMGTEIGRIARMLEQTKEEPTPLQVKLQRFGRTIGVLVLGLCALMFGLALLRQYLAEHAVALPLLFETFLTSVSLAVAAVPEGLPAIVTIVLAIGVQRMSRQNAIVRRLPAVETLGSVTMICSDKTGTLTQNRMTVRQVWSDVRRVEAGSPDPATRAGSRMLECMTLCNDATWTQDGQTGDPTEIALLAAAAERGLHREELETRMPRVAERPFDSVRKRMSTVNHVDAAEVVYTKGALDQLLDLCTHLETRDGPQLLGPETRAAILRDAEGSSRAALRVLGFAWRTLGPSDYAADGRIHTDTLEHDLVLLGYVGMIDPPRLEVRDTIQACRRSGVEVAMITGDHRNTALAIAQELGITQGDADALSGEEVDRLDDDALREKARSVRVFARVSPEHKVRIVEAFRRNGHVVSMTGDGVNDAPSLEKADIGVAMGITGTDVAKGASDMVLTDDRFTTIVSAIAAGRNIYNNIKKSIAFLLSSNLGEVLAVFTGIMVGLGSPLRSIHILWVNLMTDTLPALSLGMDPPDPRALEQPPRSPKESLFAGGTGLYVVLNGLLVGALTLTAYLVGRAWHPEGPTGAQTMAFAVLSLTQLVHAFNLRSFRVSIFRLGFHTNPYLAGAFLIGLGLQVAVIMLPPLAGAFSVAPLDRREWLVVAALALVPLALNEGVKGVRALLRALRGS